MFLFILFCLCLHLDALRGRFLLVAAVTLSDNTLGEGKIALTYGGVVIEDCRDAVIASFADALNDGNLSQEWDIEFLCKIGHTFPAEDVIAVVG